MKLARTAGKCWLPALVLGLPSLRAVAQAPPGWALKCTPQHLVLSGLWLEAERTRTAHPRQTFTLGPQLYWGPAGHTDVPTDPSSRASTRTVRGAGLHGQHRFYLSTNPKTVGSTTLPAGFYLGYGPQVQLFRLSTVHDEWHEEIGPGNLPYLVFGAVQQQATGLRYGVAGQAGYQWVLAGRVLLDVYAGAGLRKSYYSDAGVASQFRSGPSDYAHEGLYFPAGIKIGVAL